MSCLLQKIMRREYIKAQNPSTFKEQLALIKNTPGKARGLGERQGSPQCRLGHNSHLCFTASTQHRCSFGVPPPPCSGVGGFILGTMKCPGSISFDCHIKEKYGKHISFVHFPPCHRPAVLQMLQCPRPAGTQGSNRLPAAPADARFLPAARHKSFSKDPVQGWEKKKQQTSLIVNPGEDPVLLPNAE